MARLFTDEDVSPRIAEHLQKLNHDALTTEQAGRRGSTDNDQPVFATQQDRILITHNRADFLLLHDAWRQWSQLWGVTAAHTAIVAVDQWRVESLAFIIHNFLLATPDLGNGNLMYRWQLASRSWMRYP